MIQNRITWVEFEVLQLLECNDTDFLANQIILELKAFEKLDITLAINSLIKRQLIVSVGNILKITSNGYLALQPYKVKRAVILAAGSGTRMQPETLDKPKPLVKVNQRSFIETQIDALQKANITDITIIRGYCGQQFNFLLKKYPNIKFIENPYWQTTGAIISVALAINLLAGAYVIEGDLYINNPNVIRRYQYKSLYCGITSNVVNDWYFTADSNKRIESLDHGTIYKFVGLMYWSPQDAKKIKQDLPHILRKPENWQKFIESVPFDSITNNYDIYVKPLQKFEVIEIDTYQELQDLRARFTRQQTAWQ